jgi:glutathione peroxidase
LTEKNYTQLQELVGTHGSKPFTVLGFPCNQFGKQEPGTNEEIKEFVKQYNVTFPLFDKINVNGPKAHPLFKWLKDKLPGTLGTKGIKWNFTKFLINKKGEPVLRYGPPTEPKSIEADILRLLDE